MKRLGYNREVRVRIGVRFRVRFGVCWGLLGSVGLGWVMVWVGDDYKYPKVTFEEAGVF